MSIRFLQLLKDIYKYFHNSRAILLTFCPIGSYKFVYNFKNKMKLHLLVISLQYFE